jgi:membrane protein DedA with SNARE-associated domain
VVQYFDALIHSLGPFGYATLGLAALIEYVFPPFPGDTIALLGGAYAARSGRSPIAIIAVLTLGSMAGIVAVWRVGFSIAHRIAGLTPGSRILGLDVERVMAAQKLMRERGAWVLVLNRFFPSFRAVVFLAAGASGVPLRRTLALGTLSALAWNVLLVWAGQEVGDNAESIERFFVTYRSIALPAFGVVVLAVLIRALVRRRQLRAGEGVGGSNHGPGKD